MNAREVSRKKFDAIMSKDISLRLCPLCGYGAEIVVKMPWYGKHGAMVQCSKCGHGTRMFNIHSEFHCEKSLGTPILEKSIMMGIRSAIQSWNNGRLKGGEQS